MEINSPSLCRGRTTRKMIEDQVRLNQIRLIIRFSDGSLEVDTYCMPFAANQAEAMAGAIAYALQQNGLVNFC